MNGKMVDIGRIELCGVSNYHYREYPQEMEGEEVV